MKYDLKTLNIWKEDSRSLRLLTGHPAKIIAGTHENFPVYTGSRLLDVTVADLNLSVRSYNSLKRAGLNTVGDIIHSISGWQDLLRYRNLGRTSAIEIIEAIEDYQYSILEESEKTKYRQKVVEINGLVPCTQKRVGSDEGDTSVYTVFEAAITASLPEEADSGYENETMAELRERCGEHFKFAVYHSKAFMETDIEDLGLSVRSRNCLRRAGFVTAGDLVLHIKGREDLRPIRSCGDKSADEIMNCLFICTYSLLTPEKRKAYMRELKKLNGLGS